MPCQALPQHRAPGDATCWRCGSCFKHPDTPRPAKLVALLVLAYAVSPIDLIPDFIPVLGWLDDLILLPLGIALAVRMTPRQLWLERVAEAEQGAETLPRLMWGAIIVVALWLLGAAARGLGVGHARDERRLKRRCKARCVRCTRCAAMER